MKRPNERLIDNMTRAQLVECIKFDERIMESSSWRRIRMDPPLGTAFSKEDTKESLQKLLRSRRVGVMLAEAHADYLPIMMIPEKRRYEIEEQLPERTIRD